MKGELVTFEERSCPRIPGDMLQEKIDSFRKDNESDLHHFVHGIVTEPADDSNKPNGSDDPVVVMPRKIIEYANDGFDQGGDVAPTDPVGPQEVHVGVDTTPEGSLPPRKMEIPEMQWF